MRWSNTLIPTLKENPQDAEATSHRLMLRAGLIRRLMSGGYTYLPLGLKALNKVANIVREEMNRAGAVELLMPVVQPVELWEESGRFARYKEEGIIASFTDRKGSKLCLGPTHEEVITDLVRREINSYRQLPINLYQIQTKFRDELRPRYGVLRSREFLMKDAYSFDADMEGLDKSFDAMFDAYCRIFSRCGIKYTTVEADSGAMGGSASIEFMVPCEVGEDLMAYCETCGYSANVEKALCRAEAPTARDGALAEVATPGKKTIDDVAAFLNMPKNQTIKSILYNKNEKPLMILLRGDHELNEVKLANLFPGAALKMADEAFLKTVFNVPAGFAGPVGLGENVELIADQSLKGAVGMVAGANKPDAHFQNLSLARDAKIKSFHDLRLSVAGDACATESCKGDYKVNPCIEVGHVFKLGTKYSEAMKAKFLDKDSQEKPFIMGCYGIGVNRIIASAIELSADENGFCWPMSIAPYHVIFCVLDPNDAELMKTAEGMYSDLQKSGIDVIMDDRDIRPGVKFKDADLVGIPIRLTLGSRGFKEGKIEIKHRKAEKADVCNIAEALDKVSTMIKDQMPELRMLTNRTNSPK